MRLERVTKRRKVSAFTSGVSAWYGRFMKKRRAAVKSPFSSANGASIVFTVCSTRSVPCSVSSSGEKQATQ